MLKEYNKNEEKFKVVKNLKDLYMSKGDIKYKMFYRELSKEESMLLSNYCHYLHTTRNDEYVSYGVFIEDNRNPIAFVSYSKIDREYKKELIYAMGIEPQNTIEMTRAWCSNSSPANLMSSLFQYSINEIKRKWKKSVQCNLEDKELQAITTTINPNLGFRGTSFLGCNFIPIAHRPANFTFIINDGIIYYNTRRR